MVEFAIVLAKAVDAAGAAVLFGAVLFAMYASSETKEANLRPLFVLAAGAAWAGSLGLLLSETANMAGSASAALDPSMLSAVALDTFFGKVWMARLAILCVLTSLVFGSPSRPVQFSQAVTAVALVASLALQGHSGAAFSEGKVLPLLSGATHVLAAGAWLGALSVLVVMVAGRGPSASNVSAALTKFSSIGPAIVAVLLLSGVANLWLVLGTGGLTTLLHSEYGAVLGVKLLFFLSMLALAAAHRYVLAPRLARQIASGAVATISGLRTSLFAEAALGALVLVAAATLGSTPPAIN